MVSVGFSGWNCNHALALGVQEGFLHCDKTGELFFQREVWTLEGTELEREKEGWNES